jgi:hypothetical protein
MSVLVSESGLQLKQMSITRLTRERVFGQLRNLGYCQLGEVKRLYLEANGTFTVIKHERPQPGLCILPDWDQEYIGSQCSETEKMVCNHCGNLPSQPGFEIRKCSNCGKKMGKGCDSQIFVINGCGVWHSFLPAVVFLLFGKSLLTAIHQLKRSRIMNKNYLFLKALLIGLTLTSISSVLLVGCKDGDSLWDSIIPETDEEPTSTQIEGYVFYPAVQPATDANIAQLRAPSGFKINKFADGIGKPRILVADGNGHIYASDREAGIVMMLTDADSDGMSENTKTVATIKQAHG